MKKNNIGRFIFLLLFFAIIVALFNPSFLTFLPQETIEMIELFIQEHYSTTILSNITPLAATAAGLTLFATYLFAEIINYLFNLIKFKKHRSETIRSLVGNLFKYAIYILGGVTALGCLGVDASSLFISVGVVGLIIGFGAQTLIEDVITGLFIVFEGEFEVGDIITIDGFRGEVKSIGLRTVSIIDAGGNIRVINNSEISSLINLSEVASVAAVNIPVSYNDPLEKCEEVVKNSIAALSENYPDLFKEAPVYLGLETMTETHLELLVIAKVAEEKIYDARRIMQREIRLACEKAELTIPYEG